MGATTFICKKSGSSWSGKKYTKDDGYDASVSAEAATETELQQKLRELALASGETGGISTSFNFITPKSAVYVVTIGGAAVAIAAGGGAPAAAGGGGAAQAAAPEPEPVKEEESEEEDMGFSLFD